MKLVFLHSSDIHGFLLPTDYQRRGEDNAPFSLCRLRTVVKTVVKKYGREHVIITDAGDCLQGSPLADYVHASEKSKSNDLATFAATYNQIPYDARCLGNHDFNYGLSYLRHYVHLSQAPFLNDNILFKKTHQPFLGQRALILNKDGLKVGLLGVTTQFVPHWEPKKHVKGLVFLSAFAELQKAVRRLRKQVDILAVIYHGGFECNPATGEITEPDRGENEGYRIWRKLPEIDILLTGHQHRLIQLVKNKRATVQPGYQGEAVAEVIVDIDADQKKIKKITPHLLQTKDYPPDPKMVERLKDLNQKTEKWLDQSVVHLDEPVRLKNPMQARLKGSSFLNLLQQMQLHFTHADISATALMSETAKGFETDVTLRDILLNYPFTNQLCCVKVTGAQLKQLLEHTLSFLQKGKDGTISFAERYVKPKSSLYNFDLFYPLHYEAEISLLPGHRLTKVSLHGHQLDSERVYHLAVNNYRAIGGGFYPVYTPDKIEFTVDKDYTQMLTEYLTSDHLKIDHHVNFHFY